jgi:hypothetical protein
MSAVARQPCWLDLLQTNQELACFSGCLCQVLIECVLTMQCCSDKQ